jgi:MFS transporter, PAT family, beta-lactamase induction signal transducer AmpG
VSADAGERAGSPGGGLKFWRLFLDRRLLFIGALGFASGFPWAVIGNTFSYWLSSEGLGRASIGVLGSVSVIFALNFLIAPFMDRVRLPWLSARLGQRRGWILLAQTGIVTGTLLIALLGMHSGLLLVVAAAALVVTGGAIQDVGIDAYRIELIPREEERTIAAGSAAAAAGWWTGAGLPAAFAFLIAGSADRWQLAYGFLALVACALVLITVWLPEPLTNRVAQQARVERRIAQALRMRGLSHGQSQVQARILATVVEPFVEFFRRNGLKLAAAILGFILLFKIGEAFMGRMAAVFYREIGFTAEQVGLVSGFLGWVTMVGFIALSALINVRMGIFRGLMVGGVAMALANLVYAVMAIVGPNMPLFAFAVVVDNFTTAFSTVAFVAFISFLTSRVYTATQYALMASLGNFSRTTLAAGSGFMVDQLQSWALFFVLTTVMVIPGLLLLWRIRHLIGARFNSFMNGS